MRNWTITSIILFSFFSLCPIISAQEYAHTTFIGHERIVSSVAFSPDGKILASGSWDYTIRLWNVNTGELLKTLIGHENCVSSVAFSPDGKILASGSWDHSIRIWDVDTGNHIHTPVRKDTGVAHWDRVRSVAFSPDGQILVVGSHDKSISLWDTNTWQNLNGRTEPQDKITSVKFSPDGQYVACGSLDDNVYLWDTKGQNNTNIWTLHKKLKHRNGIAGIAFNPDGKILATGAGKTIRLWNPNTGQLLNTLAGHTHSVNHLAFSRDGQTLASGSSGYQKNIILWDVKTGQLLSTLADTKNHTFSVAFSPDGQTLASGGSIFNSGRGVVKLWDLYHAYVEITPNNISDTPIIGDQFSININIADGKLVDGYQFTVEYDSSTLRYLSSSNGNYLSEGAYLVPPIVSDDKVTISAISLGGESNGNGTLATVTFEAIDFKDSVIKISDVILTNKEGDKLLHHLNDTVKLVKAAGGASPAVISITPSLIPARGTGENIVFDVNIAGGQNITDYYFHWEYFPTTRMKMLSVDKGDYFTNGIGNGDGTLATVTIEVLRVHSHYSILLDVYLIGKDGLRYIPIHKASDGFPRMEGRINVPVVIPDLPNVVNIIPSSLPHPGIGKKVVFDVNITGGHNIVDYKMSWKYIKNNLKLINNEWNNFTNAIGSEGGKLTTTTFETLTDKDASIAVDILLVNSDNFVYRAVNEQGDLPFIEIKKPVFPHGDINKDGVVNIQDLVLVASKFGEAVEDDPADVNGDGVINVQDLVIVANALGNN